MKKIISFVLVLVMVLAFTGCSKKVSENLQLPFELEDIQDIVIYKTDERIGIEDADSIKFVYEHLDGVPIETAKNEIADPGCTVYEFIFTLSNHTKVSVIYYTEAVEKGLITINGDTYFTSSDIGWIWDNIDMPTDTEKN